MFQRVLIANRGEIARRVIRTCHRLGVEAVAVYSEADADAMHVREADHAVLLGPAPPRSSYLDRQRVLNAAKESGADAVHPGYGFLSEDADFAKAVLAAGLGWIGPSPEAIAAMGDKVRARNTVAAVGVPVAAGTTDPVEDLDEALARAEQIGFPVMVKPSGGGGGIGMGVAWDGSDLATVWATASGRARSLFGSSAILLERYIPRARHVEVQVLGLADGRVIALGERDCSVQRRHQKVAEECPSPGLSPTVRSAMCEAAVAAAGAVEYRGAGTVEFLLDRDSGHFVFLEMNTRLQVEHPVTELVYGVDLVEAQLRVAAGEADPGFDPAAVVPHGHAVELRVYAEDPRTFLPGPGRITRWQEPGGEVRVDAGYTEGDLVTPFYDPLLAKLCVWGPTRDEALDRARAAVDGFLIEGPKNNLSFFRRLLDEPEFRSGDYGTSLVDELRARATDQY